MISVIYIRRDVVARQGSPTCVRHVLARQGSHTCVRTPWCILFHLFVASINTVPFSDIKNSYWMP